VGELAAEATRRDRTVLPRTSEEAGIRPFDIARCSKKCLLPAHVLAIKSLGGPTTVIAGNLLVVVDQGVERVNRVLACMTVNCGRIRDPGPASSPAPKEVR
jgi:hypothetical protein